MDQFYEARLNQLSAEFTHYLIEHPEFAEAIPDNAQVVLLDQHDPEYSSRAVAYSRQAKLTDDVPNRPIAYIDVSELAPIRLRLHSPRVLEEPPVYQINTPA